MGFWKWFNVARGSLEGVTLGEGEDALKSRNNSLSGHLVKTLNHWFVLIDELLAEDFVLNVEALNVALKVLNNLDSV